MIGCCRLIGKFILKEVRMVGLKRIEEKQDRLNLKISLPKHLRIIKFGNLVRVLWVGGGSIYQTALLSWL